MKCNEIRELLSAYADDELSSQQRELVEKHLAECPDCRNRLTKYERIQRQVASLQTAPTISNFVQSTMSRIRESGKRKNPWTVKRGLFIAIPFMVILAILSSLNATGLFLSPESVMARAYVATEAIESFRITYYSAVKTIGMTTWLDSYYQEMEYASENQYHYKTSSPRGYYPESEMELIVFPDRIYSRESPSLVPKQSSLLEKAIENANEGRYDELIPTKESTLTILSSLISINKVSTEEIDGVLCLHYHAQSDIEKIIADSKVQVCQYYGCDPSDASIQPRLNELEDFWHGMQEDVELWIGKEDYLIRQMIQIIQPVQTSNLISVHLTKGTTKYFDLNEPIVIEPPLTDSGDLLPDWQITYRE